MTAEAATCGHLENAHAAARRHLPDAIADVALITLVASAATLAVRLALEAARLIQARRA